MSDKPIPERWREVYRIRAAGRCQMSDFRICLMICSCYVIVVLADLGGCFWGAQ